MKQRSGLRKTSGVINQNAQGVVIPISQRRIIIACRTTVPDWAHATSDSQLNLVRSWNIPVSYQNWAITTYQFMTNIKGISSMKLQRLRHNAIIGMVHGAETAGRIEDVSGTRWHGRIRWGWWGICWWFGKNKHADKKHQNKKSIVVGIRDRKTGKVAASPVPEATQARLDHFIDKHVESPDDTPVYTDSSPAYKNRKNHESVNYNVGEYVRGHVHTNGIESFWALLERGYKGIFHQLSVKHLHRYINEFAGRLNIRNFDTLDMMKELARYMVGKRLTYRDVIA